MALASRIRMPVNGRGYLPRGFLVERAYASGHSVFGLISRGCEPVIHVKPCSRRGQAGSSVLINSPGAFGASGDSR